MKLSGINAVITGASQGLGLEIARAFVEEGASVSVCARTEDTLAGAAAALRQLASPGQKVLARACDVSDPGQVELFCREAVAGLGSVQVLVNNAGVYGPKGPIESVSWEDWKRAIEVNLYGVALPSRALIPHFKQQGGGRIINLSGGGATAPLPFISAYAASKTAVVRLTETLAEELCGHGIAVNAVAPGALNTRMLDEVLAAGPSVVGEANFKKALRQKENGGAPMRLAAELCVFLASAESEGITGRLVAAVWDQWRKLRERRRELDNTDIYTLRRVLPSDRGLKWE
jgi:NAD(P)-dependent dehydrogenase (short-subunit alcohol dehydrogenase family)